jgi:hypothetical protein
MSSWLGKSVVTSAYPNLKPDWLPMTCRLLVAILLVFLSGVPLRANPPEASYIFPAGGQRGTTVKVKVGGVFLHEKCRWELLGPGVKASKELKRIPTTWFEGPLLPIPDSQRVEDYPKDMAGEVAVAKDAALGLRPWRLWTSQGATPSLKFMVGDLPEIVEEEVDGDPVPVKVTLPVTINGRIFPRGNVDVWTFDAKKGQTIRCEVYASRLGSPLDARLEVLDAKGRKIAENDDTFGADPFVLFTAPADGNYQVRVMDTRYDGGQAFVYRLTLSADLHVDTVFPLGGPRGGKILVYPTGQGIPPGPQEVMLSTAKASEMLHTLVIGGKETNGFWLELDDLPEYVAVPAQAVALPAIFNGRIGKAGVVETWSWTAHKGDIYEFDLRAGRLGSPLDGVLSIYNNTGKELARAEAPAGQLDANLIFTVPADGTYSVRVQDRLQSRGGPSFAYRLRVAAPTPDFRLRLAGDAVTVPRGGQGKLKVFVDRLGGFKEPIVLNVTDLPAGVTAMPATLGAGQNVLDVTLKADLAAKIDVTHCTIQGTAKLGGQTASRTAKLKGQRGEFEIDTVLLAVALPTPFKIKGEYDMGFAARGGPHKRVYKIERLGYDGPIEISLADKQARHLQGVTGPTIIVPAGVSEFAYTVQLPPWMETGRTCRVCVMGVATIKDKDGNEHRVSFSSVHQNEQLVAVVGPGKLSLETDRTSVIVSPNKPAVLKLSVTRAADLKGPVQLDLILPAHVRGVKAEPATIPAGKHEGELRIVCTDELGGPLNMPLTVRATVMHEGQPVVAEIKVDVQPK